MSKDQRQGQDSDQETRDALKYTAEHLDAISERLKAIAQPNHAAQEELGEDWLPHLLGSVVTVALGINVMVDLERFLLRVLVAGALLLAQIALLFYALHSTDALEDLKILREDKKKRLMAFSWALLAVMPLVLAGAALYETLSWPDVMVQDVVESTDTQPMGKDTPEFPTLDVVVMKDGKTDIGQPCSLSILSQSGIVIYHQDQIPLSDEEPLSIPVSLLDVRPSDSQENEEIEVVAWVDTGKDTRDRKEKNNHKAGSVTITRGPRLFVRIDQAETVILEPQPLDDTDTAKRVEVGGRDVSFEITVLGVDAQQLRPRVEVVWEGTTLKPDERGWYSAHIPDDDPYANLFVRYGAGNAYSVYRAQVEVDQAGED